MTVRTQRSRAHRNAACTSSAAPTARALPRSGRSRQAPCSRRAALSACRMPRQPGANRSSSICCKTRMHARTHSALSRCRSTHRTICSKRWATRWQRARAIRRAKRPGRVPAGSAAPSLPTRPAAATSLSPGDSAGKHTGEGITAVVRHAIRGTVTSSPRPPEAGATAEPSSEPPVGLAVGPTGEPAAKTAEATSWWPASEAAGKPAAGLAAELVDNGCRRTTETTAGHAEPSRACRRPSKAARAARLTAPYDAGSGTSPMSRAAAPPATPPPAARGPATAASTAAPPPSRDRIAACSGVRVSTAGLGRGPWASTGLTAIAPPSSSRQAASACSSKPRTLGGICTA